MKASTGKGPKIEYRPPYRTIAWADDRVLMLDQRRLPLEERYLTLRNYAQVADAIRDLAIRGAPAIGIAAAMGCALGAVHRKEKRLPAFRAAFERVCERMVKARPTAVNLAWAVERMRRVCHAEDWRDVASVKQALVEEALRIQSEDLDINLRMAEEGSRLIPAGSRIMTYCNAGTLATGGYGTAVGVIRACWRQRKNVEIFACETRPFLQGARLTTWELIQEGIPVTLITDNAAGYLMQTGRVDCAIVGADRVAANGDVANKIGTYTVATLCRANKIPFYVAAPLSTIDPDCPTGAEIPIEYRDPEEVTRVRGCRVAPEGCKVLHPAFDVTPAALVTAIITEEGVARPPYRKHLRALRRGAG